MYCTTFTKITQFCKTCHMYNAVYERRKAVSSYMRRRDAVFTVFQETIEIVCTVNYILLANNQ